MAPFAPRPKDFSQQEE